MRRRLQWLLLVLTLAVPSYAWAEGFVDLFLGASFTQDSDIRGSVDGSLNGVSLNESGSIEVEHETSFLAGGRIGWWTEFAGLNLDASWFRPETDPDKRSVACPGSPECDFIASVLDSLGFVTPPFTATAKTDLDVVAVGLNVMFRAPLFKSTDVPDGRLQLYVFGGPTLFISTLDAEVTATALGVTETASDSDTDLSVGVTAGAGVTFMLIKNVGLFGEYRFTHARPEFELQSNSLRAKLEADLNTHHFLAGVTFRF